jgi:hypothetical protein
MRARLRRTGSLNMGGLWWNYKEKDFAPFALGIFRAKFFSAALRKSFVSIAAGMR